MRTSTSLPQAFKSSEAITLGDVVSTYELGLVMIAGAREDTLETPVDWVHSSDLKNPAPFLTPRTVLLTTGSQFTQNVTLKESNEYIRGLQDAGVSALGFAIETGHDRIPQNLIDACEKAGLPLFRVPYDTPFIQISQRAARLLAAKNYARELWSLDTQRAIARSAIKTKDLTGAVETLAERLKRFIVITSKTGRILYQSGLQDRIRTKNLETVAREARNRQAFTHTSTNLEGTKLHLQTIPGAKSGHGAIIVEAEPVLDHADLTAVELVATLAAFSLELSEVSNSTENKTQGIIMSLLMGEAVDLALELARAASQPLSSEPKHVLFFGPATDVEDSSHEELRAIVGSEKGSILSIYEENLVAVTNLKTYRKINTFLSDNHLSTGVSSLTQLSQLKTGLSEAKTAYESATAHGGPVKYSKTMEIGILSRLFDDSEAKSRAQLFLSPLTGRDAKYDDELVTTLEVWLQNHGQTSQTAQTLGLHRHTVTNRIKLISDLLQRDMQSPDVRAECWSAIKLISR